MLFAATSYCHGEKKLDEVQVGDSFSTDYIKFIPRLRKPLLSHQRHRGAKVTHALFSKH